MIPLPYRACTCCDTCVHRLMPLRSRYFLPRARLTVGHLQLNRGRLHHVARLSLGRPRVGFRGTRVCDSCDTCVAHGDACTYTCDACVARDTHMSRVSTAVGVCVSSSCAAGFIALSVGFNVHPFTVYSTIDLSLSPFTFALVRMKNVFFVLIRQFYQAPYKTWTWMGVVVCVKALFVNLKPTYSACSYR